MFGGTALARVFHFSWQEAIFIGTILTATSVTITAQTLINLKQLRSKAGSTILGAAVIDDVLGLIVLSFLMRSPPRLHRAVPCLWAARCDRCEDGRLPRHALLAGASAVSLDFSAGCMGHGHHTEVAAALIVAFLLAFQAQWLGGMAAITGAYIAGLFVAQTPAHQKVLQDLNPIIHSFFGPLFFVAIGLAVNARRIPKEESCILCDPVGHCDPRQDCRVRTGSALEWLYGPRVTHRRGVGPPIPPRRGRFDYREPRAGGGPGDQRPLRAG